MKKVLVLTFALLTGVAFAESVKVFSCDFEAGEGFNLGSVYNQQGWYRNGENFNFIFVTNSVSYSGAQCLCFTNTTKGVGISHDISYVNPYSADVLFSFAFIPGTSFVRYQLFDTEGKRIKKFAIQSSMITFDNPWNAPALNIDPNSWYFATIRLDVKNNVFKTFEISKDAAGDVISLQDIPFDTSEGGSGDIGKLSLSKEWTDTEPTFIDDINIDLVPEPASLGLLAFVGLFFLRKRS